MELLNLLIAYIRADMPTWTILVLIAVNFALAVCAAWRNGTFDPRKLANVYGRHIFPMVGGYYALRIGILALGAEGPLQVGADVAALGIIVAALVASIWKHLGDLGLPTEPMNALVKNAAQKLGFGAVPPPDWVGP